MPTASRSVINKIKPGINTPIICRKCGHKVGTIRLKQKLKWKIFWNMIGLALILEFIANLIIYILFNGN